MRLRSLLPPLLLATCLVAACHGQTSAPAPAALPAAAPVAAPPSAPAVAPAAPSVDCAAQFPQLPLSDLRPQDRNEFCKFAGDTLCYCGCPHTVGGCLKQHPSCHHAVRMATLALSEIVATSATADAAAKFVNGYYDSFKAENRVKLPVDTLPCQGSPDASLTLVEFSDFDCPHCKAARPMFEQLVKDRHDTRLCFASYPIHKNSKLAAAAAEYARKKGAFWRFHDLLFETQDSRATLEEDQYVESLLKLAGQAGLDPEGMKAALADADVANGVLELKNFGHQLGIDGTPWVYLNGRVLPPFSPELYQLTLDDEREWVANHGHWAQD